jgi:prepilin-type processing-associated H-X9-DG protein
VDYVVNTMPPDLKFGETRELSAPTRASVWNHPGKVLLLADTAYEEGYTSWQNGASTSPDLRESRENHERAKQYVPGTPFDTVTQGSLSRMDFFLPEHMPSQPKRRPGSITHMRSFANWLYVDGHVGRLPWLNNARPCKQWLQMVGVLDPNLNCW